MRATFKNLSCVLFFCLYRLLIYLWADSEVGSGGSCRRRPLSVGEAAATFPPLNFSVRTRHFPSPCPCFGPRLLLLLLLFPRATFFFYLVLVFVLPPHPPLHQGAFEATFVCVRVCLLGFFAVSRRTRRSVCNETQHRWKYFHFPRGGSWRSASRTEATTSSNSDVQINSRVFVTFSCRHHRSFQGLPNLPRFGNL